LDECVALLSYDGVGREMVASLKYRSHRSAIAGLAAAMAALVDQGDGEGLGAEVVTWAPTTSRRRRQRGFDQAELLAKGVARSIGLPVARLLRRRPGPPQTGKSAAERREGPIFLPTRPVPAGQILLVDDVVTTGSTLVAAALVLRQAGAKRVVALAVARTPFALGARRPTI
ncbi:MAG: ComF family protein, partial [Acidimicrobiia bacterium]|nr:ComF family protein [Acidimicrobiia bacterium]